MLSDAQILFPNSIIPTLRHLRGEGWAALVDHICTLPDNDPEVLAFVLMFIRLNKCLDCELDSFRALNGCHFCTVRTLKRFKGTDEDLLDRFRQALAQIKQYQSQNYLDPKLTNAA